MHRRVFLSIWLGFSLLYLALAAAGPGGLFQNGMWPFINQHLLQVKAWRGEDIQLPSEDQPDPDFVAVRPGLAVTPYFEHWVQTDPRERTLLSNIAVGVRRENSIEPVKYVPADSVVGQSQTERMECHVGMPLGPAFLMLPLRFVFGSALATQWLGALLGGLAVALMDRLLSWWLVAIRGEAAPTGWERAMLLSMAGAGTLWIWLTPRGEVWYFAQTVATCAFTLALVLAWRRHWLCSGFAFAIAFTSRPTLLLGLPILLAILVDRCRPDDRLEETGRASPFTALLRAGTVPLLLGGLHLALNQLRFGSMLEFGYRFMLTPATLRQAFETYGPFDLHFFGTNLKYLFLQPPVAVVSESGSWSFPFLASDPFGMGILFVTPAFACILLTFRGDWRKPRLITASWLSLVLITIPPLFYFNTGWVQWGGRYLLDAWPLWMMLAALGLERLDRRVAALLVIVSIISNTFAAVITAAGLWP